MDRQEVISQVEKYIFQSVLTKGEIESNKLEFKRTWYKLNSDEVYTCARHISGIANSLGGGDAFLVFGYDPRDQTFHPARLSDSGFTDPTEIFGIVNRRISNDVSFEIIDYLHEGNAISIVHILPSISKPHLLPYYIDKNKKEFKHITFIRNGTKTDIATKEDFERMYMDRTNIFVDHKLEVVILKSSIKVHAVQHPNNVRMLSAYLNVTFENLGTRVLSLREMLVTIQNIPELGDTKVVANFEHWFDRKRYFGLNLQPNELKEEVVYFYGDHLTLSADQIDVISLQLEEFNKFNISITDIQVVSMSSKILFPTIVFS